MTASAPRIAAERDDLYGSVTMLMRTTGPARVVLRPQLVLRQGGEIHYRQIRPGALTARPCDPPGSVTESPVRQHERALLSAFPAPSPVSVIVARLRAAGCVFAEDEARLLVGAARTPADLAAMVDRRAAGLPLEHVIGWAEFCGLRVAVDPGVFVPRRRTEFLVRHAATLARQAATLARQAASRPGPASARAPHVVVDLCCGSGAVGVALVAALDRAELHAADLDPAAVRCARRNVAAVGGQVYEGDLYQPLPARLRGRVDVLVANAPYVPTEAVELLPPEARMHEPRAALDGGADGLDVLRRVVAAAPLWLAPAGHLLVETSERQAPATAEAVARNGLIPGVVRSDKLNATVVIGTQPALHGGPSG
jgi:release factor glutamine methyltransferase